MQRLFFITVTILLAVGFLTLTMGLKKGDTTPTYPDPPPGSRDR